MPLKSNQSDHEKQTPEFKKRAGSATSIDGIVQDTKQVSNNLKPLSKVNTFNAMEGFSARHNPVNSDINVPTKQPQKQYINPRQEMPEEEDEPQTQPAADNGSSTSKSEDQELDKAIDDILIKESNDLLAAQDAAIDAETRPLKNRKNKRFSLKRLLKNKWFYFSLGLIIIIIFALPFSRYKILGLFMENQYQFNLVDSSTQTPVSGATITVNGKNFTTNGSGQVLADLPLGSHSYVVKKHYYRTKDGSLFVGLSQPMQKVIDLYATGRQVPIKVINKISGQPLAGAEVKVLNTNAKTNSSGQAFIVLPTTSSNYSATISENDYNTVTANLLVTTNASANTVDLVPNGSAYFLSDTTGVIDVIKANLDGSDPQVMLAGTGSESKTNTYLMASPDLKYLVLETQRSGSQPELYVINTANNQLTEFDSSADTFSLIGWNGDQFIYDEINNAEATSVTGREQLKSYNAATQQLNVLDQDLVSGDPNNGYEYQSFYNFELLPTVVVYNTEWHAIGTYDQSASTNTIRGVGPSGLNKKDYYTFPADSTSPLLVTRYQPDGLYYSATDTTTNQTSYYNYQSGAVTADSSVTAASFSQTYPTYYLSPSGQQTLWSQTTNGQTVTYEGDANGQNQKLVNIPSTYSAYGWYDNIYILLSNDGQLYIAPAGGSKIPVLIGSYLASS